MQPNDSQPLLIQSVQLRKELLGGICKATLHKLVKDPSSGFPQPIRIGARNFWRRAEVIAWVNAREVAA